MEDTSHRNLQGKPKKGESLICINTHITSYTHVHNSSMCMRCPITLFGYFCPNSKSYLVLYVFMYMHVFSQRHTLRFDRHNIVC